MTYRLLMPRRAFLGAVVYLGPGRMPTVGREKSSLACVRDGVTVDCGTSGTTTGGAIAS
jgi:hypothetical protein